MDTSHLKPGFGDFVLGVDIQKRAGKGWSVKTTFVVDAPKKQYDWHKQNECFKCYIVDSVLKKLHLSSDTNSILDCS